MRGLGRAPTVATHTAATVSEKATLASTISDLRRAADDIIRVNHASDEERDRRLLVCSECEFKVGSRCNLCRCFINYKAKLANSECPVGKWSASVGESTIDGPSQQ